MELPPASIVVDAMSEFHRLINDKCVNYITIDPRLYDCQDMTFCPI